MDNGQIGGASTSKRRRSPSTWFSPALPSLGRGGVSPKEGGAPFVPHGLGDNEGGLRFLSMGWATAMLERNGVIMSLNPMSSYGYLLRMAAI